MDNSHPLVSVITVVLNREKTLEQAIQSVINQGYPNIEYIIIDGGSTDRSVEIIEKYSGRIAYWVSETDNGIYNAMNKGVRMANGDIIGLVNADDFYFPDTIAKVVETFQTEGNIDIVHGNQVTINDYDEFSHFRIMKPRFSQIRSKPSIFHPTCFVKKKVYNSIGIFDESYRVVADYDFLLRAVENNSVFHYINHSITGFRSGGISSLSTTPCDKLRLKKSHPYLPYTRLQIYWKSCQFIVKEMISRIINYEHKLKIKRMNEGCQLT